MTDLRSQPAPPPLSQSSQRDQRLRPEEIFSDIDDALERIAAHCNAYRGGSTWRSIAQLALNLSLYGGLIAACFLLIRSGFWWASLILSIPAAGMLVRLFIIQHDCGHGSFFSNKRANHAVGWILSLFTFTPFGFWRDAHNRHHAHSGNLTRRGMGGVDTLTVEEFKRLSPFKKALYKFYRHPFTLLILGPPIYFILLQRIPHAGPMPYTEVYMGMQSRHIWRSVMLLNGALLFIYGFIMAGFGVGATLLVFVPAVSLAGTIGTWLFYIQHQYEDAYWRPHERWDYKRAALFGSSHYDLPPLLQWFTGNIGLHHIHHLCSLIPNYRLQECFDASTDLQKLPKLTIRESLRCARLALWDEQCERMVSFRAAA